MTLLFELVAVAALILLNAFFVAAEYGLVTSRRTRIIELEHQGNRRARAVVQIVADPPRFIAAMQLGVTLTSLGIGALGEQALTHAFDPVMSTLLAVVLAYLLLTFFHVVIGELVPKGLALGHSETVALALSAPVRGFFILFKPLIWVLQRATELVLRALGLDPPGAENEVHSEAELRMLLNASAESGEIEQGEQEMLYKVFDFADKEASDVMVPRPEVVALSVEMPPEEELTAVIDSPYTRYPVYRDWLDDVVGILHLRDLIKALHDRGLAEVRIAERAPGPVSRAGRRGLARRSALRGRRGRGIAHRPPRRHVPAAPPRPRARRRRRLGADRPRASARRLTIARALNGPFGLLNSGARSVSVAPGRSNSKGGHLKRFRIAILIAALTALVVAAGASARHEGHAAKAASIQACALLPDTKSSTRYTPFDP